MYDIAMAVAACLRAGTRADVAWLVDVDGLQVGDWSGAVVFTPGGGRIGALLDGAVDAKLAEMAGLFTTPRLVDVEMGKTDALIAGLPSEGSARTVLAPAETLPGETWALANAREPFCLVADLDGDDVRSLRVYSADTISGAAPWIGDLFARGASGSVTSEGALASMFAAVPQMVVVGGGPVAEAVVRVAGFLGWQARLANEHSMATGLIASLSGRDKVVIAAHDLELAGAGLAAALDSDCGYIGSVGSRKMQADRADWLAYRGKTDLTRVHGPAGLDIGASAPEEVAVAVVAEAIAEARGHRP